MRMRLRKHACKHLFAQGYAWRRVNINATICAGHAGCHQRICGRVSCWQCLAGWEAGAAIQMGDALKLNPMEFHPLASSASNPWNKHRANEELRREIVRPACSSLT